jgi:hypothetical protein
MQPSQASTSGGDAVFITVRNIDVDRGFSLFLGLSEFTLNGHFCTVDPKVCSISAIAPASLPGVFNVTLVTNKNISFTLPRSFAAVQPVPVLDFCFPQVGLISGGTQVKCYILNIPPSSCLVANIKSRFDITSASLSGTRSTNSVCSVDMTSPATEFEGNSTIHISVETVMFSFFPFIYVRPCNFEIYCTSRGLIPSDLKLLQQPLQDNSCSLSYCLDPATLPIPSIAMVFPSVVSSVGGTSVTLFASRLLAVSAADVSVSIASPLSPLQISATVISFNLESNDVVILTPPIPTQGLHSVIVSTRRSRQLIVGTKFLVASIFIESPIIGKALAASIFPTSIPHNTVTLMYVTLKNFVPVSGTEKALFSVNFNQQSTPGFCRVLFSSRSSTLVLLELPAFAGPGFLNVSIWNTLVSKSRSADFNLLVEAPPVPVVVSLYPDVAEAASNTIINLGLANMPATASLLYIRNATGSFVANVSKVLDSEVDLVLQFFQFSLPNSPVSGSYIDCRVFIICIGSSQASNHYASSFRSFVDYRCPSCIFCAEEFRRFGECRFDFRHFINWFILSVVAGHLLHTRRYFRYDFCAVSTQCSLRHAC